MAEAMWKGKPVVAGATGGITVQIVYGLTGYTLIEQSPSWSPRTTRGVLRKRKIATARDTLASRRTLREALGPS